MNPVQFQEFLAQVLGMLQRLLGWSPSGSERVYAYQPDDYPIAGSATAGGLVYTQIKMNADSAFVWTKSVAHIPTSYSSSFDIRDVQIAVILGGSDQQIFKTEHGSHILNSWGTATDPFVLPKPQYIARNANLSIRVRSLTANSRSVYLDLWGYKTQTLDATKF